MIGYYVHHQGRGHLHRMHSIAAHLSNPVTVLSSLVPTAEHRGPWVTLARDDVGGAPVDEEAHGVLHWVPRYDAGLGLRSAEITAWLERVRPTLVVVDVSVEVSLLVRLAGVPVVVVAMPGARMDPAHQIAYDVADALLAPWPETSADDEWPHRWLEKTSHVGAFSEFDELPRAEPPSPSEGTGKHKALLLWGSGGTVLPETLLEGVRSATPGWSWDAVGVGEFRSRGEVWQALCAADVVVSHGGQNAVAEVAAARAPAVVIADPRPFSEQEHTVRALQAAGLAVGLERWPTLQFWPHLLARALEIGGEGWQSWCPGNGARRAASALDELAFRLDPSPASRQPVPVSPAGATT